MKNLRSELIADTPQAAKFFRHSPKFERLLGLARDSKPMPAEILKAIANNQSTENQDSSRLNSLEKLAAGAAVIVTGQQPGMFGGPTLVDFKIATAICLAKKVEEAGIPCVPIFWNASEDHDLNEANRLFLRRPARDQTDLYRLDFGERQQSLWRINFDLAQTEQLREWFLTSGEQSPDAHDFPREEESISTWFTRVLTNRFSGQGLLVVEPRHLVPTAPGFFENAISMTKTLSASFEDQSKAIESAGFRRQLDALDSDQTWVFVDHPDQRKRIRVSGETIRASGQEFPSASMLTDSLGEMGALYSCSAHLRPLFQQETLNPIAQISGPAEIAYAAQLFGVFETLGLRSPIFWPRFQGVFVSPKEQKLVDDLNVGVGAMFSLAEPAWWELNEQEWPEAWAKTLQVLSEARENFRTATQSQAKDNSDLTSPIANYLKAEDKTFEGFQKKIQKQLRRLHQEKIQRYSRLRESLRPKESPQERVRSLACYPGATSSIIDTLMKNLDPNQHEPQILRTDEL